MIPAGMATAAAITAWPGRTLPLPDHRLAGPFPIIAWPGRTLPLPQIGRARMASTVQPTTVQPSRSEGPAN